MPALAKALAGALCLSLYAHVAVAQPVRKTSLGMSAIEAGEVLLRDVCMVGKYDGKVIAELAKQQAAIEQSAKFYKGGPNDKAYRMGPISNPVYAVDWADGACTTRVSRGDAEALRAMAERVILARPEGFVRGAHGPENGGRVVRTVYCGFVGSDRLVASITTPTETAPRGTVALSSTVYRTQGPSALCEAAVPTTP